MYVSSGELENEVLRQGDILSQIHILGAINLNAIQYMTNNNQEKLGWNISNPPRYADVMVLSHSCEIAIENNVKLTSIILAPLRDIHTATNKEKIDDLIQSNEIDETTQASYLKYFYIPPNDLLQYKKGSIVDFSKCFSVRKNSYDLLLKRKRIQLKPEATLKMAKKLALYFYRT